MDTDNQCIANATAVDMGSSPVRHGTEGLFVPQSCAVCTNSSPCLFEVVSDPAETKNLAKEGADVELQEIIDSLAAKLDFFNDPYIPSALTAANLACYDCAGSDTKGVGKWGKFWGPCCTRRGG